MAVFLSPTWGLLSGRHSCGRPSLLIFVLAGFRSAAGELERELAFSWWIVIFLIKSGISLLFFQAREERNGINQLNWAFYLVFFFPSDRDLSYASFTREVSFTLWTVHVFLAICVEWTGEHFTLRDLTFFIPLDFKTFIELQNLSLAVCIRDVWSYFPWKLYISF